MFKGQKLFSMSTCRAVLSSSFFYCPLGIKHGNGKGSVNRHFSDLNVGLYRVSQLGMELIARRYSNRLTSSGRRVGCAVYGRKFIKIPFKVRRHSWLSVAGNSPVSRSFLGKACQIYPRFHPTWLKNPLYMEALMGKNNRWWIIQKMLYFGEHVCS